MVAGPKLAITGPRQGSKHLEMMNSLVQKRQNLISLTLRFLHLMIIPFTLNLKNDLVIASYFFNLTAVFFETGAMLTPTKS